MLLGASGITCVLFRGIIHSCMRVCVWGIRYSEEFKYRPAASPIITERLKDGRVRLRGAYPST